MKIYILIVALYSGHGPAITTQEFNSLDSCKAAAEIIMDNYQSFFVQAKVDCVPK